ncbi:uncharacterized protein LOC122865583 [Xyrichtys novacula]|uniref:Uncharacterized protein LOC122865583 n=1 Tax=Xyrichtys novacula TaxID=13765 RepID=A0AAV1FI50_XYRNO|nr:uncharacterized protein LOC122865583 [Xyrichtys novacula]
MRIETDDAGIKQHLLITIDQEDYGSSNASSSDSLGAKPKSSHWNLGVTSRAQRPEICDETGWPKLSSTPVQRKKQPWIAAKGGPKIKNNLPPQQPSLPLHNRFAPLLRNPGSSSPHSRFPQLLKNIDALPGGDHQILFIFWMKRHRVTGHD